MSGRAPVSPDRQRSRIAERRDRQGNRPRRDAVQLLRLPARLPAGRAAAARRRRTLSAAGAAAASRRAVLRFLRVVGLALPAAASRLDRRELARGPRPAAGSHRLAVSGGTRRQPRGAGRLQVSRIPHRSRRHDPRHRPSADRSGPAARDLVLHLPSHHVPDGPEGRARAGLRADPLRPLHRLLPAGSRRPARALERDHAPVRGAPLCASRRGRADRARADAADRRAFQEGVPRRSALGLCQPGVPGGGRGQGGDDGRGVAGDARLHLPDLFRLFRLHRHGARPRAPVRDRAAAEFRRALPRHLAARPGGAGT